MDTEKFLAYIDIDGRALLEAVAAAPAATVQACPGWTNRDLAKHMGGVYAFVTAQLQAGNPQTRMPSDAPEAPDDGDITTWLGDRHHDVLTALRVTPAEAPTWTWIPEKTAAFFHRRMAHETAVHRCDAQCEAGTLTPFNCE